MELLTLKRLGQGPFDPPPSMVFPEMCFPEMVCRSQKKLLHGHFNCYNYDVGYGDYF